MKGKKGAVEIQFNWIFVLIVGALILVFFFAIANKQKDISQRQLGDELTSQLDLLFTGQGVSANTIRVISTPDIPIEFTCEDYSMWSIPKRLGNTIVFAPQEMSGKSMIGLTQPWTVPFKVTNFFYLTNPNIKYYFVDAPAEVQEELEKILPESTASRLSQQVDKTFITSAEIPSVAYENNPQVKFVFFNSIQSLPPDFTSAADKTVSAIVLQPSGQTLLEQYSDATFYRKIGNAFVDDTSASSSSLPTIQKGGVLGAIFSDSAELYECNTNRASHKLKNVAEMYLARSNELALSRPRCDQYFSRTPLRNIINAVQANDIQQIESAISAGKGTLEGLNRDALRASCPTMY